MQPKSAPQPDTPSQKREGRDRVQVFGNGNAVATGIAQGVSPITKGGRLCQWPASFHGDAHDARLLMIIALDFPE
jgi:hypothetical protein